MIASAYVLKPDVVPVLVEAATKKRGWFRRAVPFEATLAQQTRALAPFEADGYFVGTALGLSLNDGLFGHEDAATVLTERLQATHSFLTPSELPWLESLERFAGEDPEKLRQQYEEFNEYSMPGAGTLLAAAFRWLMDLRGSIGEGTHVLLIIG